jgi:hypothetical protein
LHSRVAILYKPEAIGSRVIECCNNFLEGIERIEHTLEEYTTLLSSIDSQINVIVSLFGHLGLDPDA